MEAKPDKYKTVVTYTRYNARYLYNEGHLHLKGVKDSFWHRQINTNFNEVVSDGKLYSGKPMGYYELPKKDHPKRILNYYGILKKYFVTSMILMKNQRY